MMRLFLPPRVIVASLLCLLLTNTNALLADDDDGPGGGEKEEKEAEPSDLTFANLFSAGWHESFEERSSEGRAVRIPLFRTRLGFLEREVRGAYQFTRNADSGAADEHEMELELAVPLNRRFMLEASPEYVWTNRHDAPGQDVPSWTALGALQLVDTYSAALNIQFDVGSPLKGDFEDSRTRLGVAVATFLDLGNRVGLQAHLGHDSLVGVNPRGEASSELNYAVALTKTLTEERTLFSNLTPTIEMWGVTQLDGDAAGQTLVSFIPGIQWELKKDWWLSAGIETPVTGPHLFDETFHFATYKDF